MTANADTAARSLEHWSEAGRAEMDAFYALAREDYRRLALAVDHGALLGAVAARAGRDRLTLLDVACGSGKFPEALLTHAGVGGLPLTVACDLLDPSAFSIAEAAAVLRPPFAAAAEHETTIEALDPAAGPYDLLWATHALYAVEPDQLPRAVTRIRAAIAPGGVGLIANGARDGHYLRFYRAFLDGVRGGAGTQFTSSEDLLAELRRTGAEPEVLRLRYDHEIALDATATVEGYLQRCAFDDTVPLAAMLDAPGLGAYLAGCRDPAAGVWRFAHEVDLILLGDVPAGVVPRGGA